MKQTDGQDRLVQTGERSGLTTALGERGLPATGLKTRKREVQYDEGLVCVQCRGVVLNYKVSDGR